MLSVENSGLVVAGWNANLSFGQDEDRERQNRAFQYVKAMGDDIGILCIPELMNAESSERHLASIRSRFADLGFTNSVVTFGVRQDQLRLGLWSKQAYEGGLIDIGVSRRCPRRQRYLPYMKVPGLGTAIGIHNPSDDEYERSEIAEGVVDHITGGTGKPEDAKSTTIFGDFNAGSAKDGRNARVFHFADYVLRAVPKLIEIDYQSNKRLVHLAGVAIRASAMSRGGTMKIYHRAGLIDADPSAEPTVFYNMPVFGNLRVDHLLASPDIAISNYKVAPRTIDSEKPVSDHSGLRATVRNSQLLEAIQAAARIGTPQDNPVRFAA